MMVSDDARHLLDEALRLPLRERSQLAEELLRSLDDEEAKLAPAEWERLWTDEIARLVDGEEALARARSVLKPRP